MSTTLMKSMSSFIARKYLPILSVSLLHTALTSQPGYLAGKGEERQIEKTQTYTTLTY